MHQMYLPRFSTRREWLGVAWDLTFLKQFCLMILSLTRRWLARLAQRFKRSLIRQILSRAPKNCDKIKLIDKIVDGMVLSVLLVKILDYLSVETGIALGSIFAVGSTGTLIISLGSQEIAKGVVNGVEMAASDRFYEGDNVHFGDG